MKSHQIWWQSTRNLRSYQQANKIYVENTVLIGLKRNAFCSQFFSHWISFNGHPERTFECNLTGRCPFFKNPTTRLGKKFAFRYPVSELLDYKIFRKTIPKTIVYCSLKTLPYCS